MASPPYCDPLDFFVEPAAPGSLEECIDFLLQASPPTLRRAITILNATITEDIHSPQPLLPSQRCTSPIPRPKGPGPDTWESLTAEKLVTFRTYLQSLAIGATDTNLNQKLDTSQTKKKLSLHTLVRKAVHKRILNCGTFFPDVSKPAMEALTAHCVDDYIRDHKSAPGEHPLLVATFPALLKLLLKFIKRLP